MLHLKKIVLIREVSELWGVPQVESKWKSNSEHNWRLNFSISTVKRWNLVAQLNTWSRGTCKKACQKINLEKSEWSQTTYMRKGMKSRYLVTIDYSTNTSLDFVKYSEIYRRSDWPHIAPMWGRNSIRRYSFKWIPVRNIFCS